MPDIKTALSKKFKKLPTFAENYFINLIFLKIYIFRVPQVKTQFSLSQKNILVIETQWIKLTNYERLESQKMTHPSTQSLTWQLRGEKTIWRSTKKQHCDTATAGAEKTV